MLERTPGILLSVVLALASPALAQGNGPKPKDKGGAGGLAWYDSTGKLVGLGALGTPFVAADLGTHTVGLQLEPVTDPATGQIVYTYPQQYRIKGTHALTFLGPGCSGTPYYYAPNFLIHGAERPGILYDDGGVPTIGTLSTDFSFTFQSFFHPNGSCITYPGTPPTNVIPVATLDESLSVPLSSLWTPPFVLK